GADSVAHVLRVRVPPPRPELALTGPLVVDSSSASPRAGGTALREDEPVRVSVRAPANANAWVVAGGTTRRLVNTEGNFFATDLAAGALKAGGTLFVSRDRD